MKSMNNDREERGSDAAIAMLCAKCIESDVKAIEDWLESNKALTSEFDKASEMICDIQWNLSAINGAVLKWKEYEDDE